MNKDIQQKIEQYKKMAGSHKGNVVSSISKSVRNDSLSKVIRTKKEGDDFMAEVESIFQRTK